MRFTNGEKYVIVINPFAEKVKAVLRDMHTKQATYVFGTGAKAVYKIGKDADEITLPAVSAVIYKID